jgi:hypothetical protein
LTEAPLLFESEEAAGGADGWGEVKAEGLAVRRSSARGVWGAGDVEVA